MRRRYSKGTSLAPSSAPALGTWQQLTAGSNDSDNHYSWHKKHFLNGSGEQTSVKSPAPYGQDFLSTLHLIFFNTRDDMLSVRNTTLAISHKSTQSALSVLTQWQMMQLIPQLFFRLCYWCTSTVLGPAQIRNMHSIPDQQSHEGGAKSSKFRHRFQAQAVFLPAQCASGAPLFVSGRMAAAHFTMPDVLQ
ncbi:hypothetical protein [Anaerobiospirillum sp. NML120449]|uniref:hypothetical protein n=1 Tax=Anaerobiospirillum sp. NML120449 TaxID=2932817 RepID=UPI001FF4E5BB|nr:hypothetical protein [Anaerobiospirillum sp. NML120449]MCK0526413.1 hypothetical protein [Anaerobiospirillum sp. NML120449]